MTPSPSRLRISISSVAIVASLTACTIGVGERREEVSPSNAPPSPSGSADAPPAGSVVVGGRLAVVERNGALYTMRSDGSDRVDLIAGGDPALAAVQPAWSPDGSRLAWVVADRTGGPGAGAIVVAGSRGEDPVVNPAPFVPYYLSWDPTGSRVAFLGSSGNPETPVEMGMLEVGAEATAPKPVAGGSPFLYFAWGPDGENVLAHAGYDRLEEIDLDGGATAVSARPGLFSTPAWSADGKTLVYAERAQGVQRLVAQVGGEEPRVLVEGRGALSFVLRPDGGAVAYQMLGPDEGDFFDRRPSEPDDGVRVVDLRTRTTDRATRMRAMTFWWSPDSERLLALAPQPEATDTIPFTWEVWDGRETSVVQGHHAPTFEVLQNYAPFFTQYALSTTPWAPDGSAFAFAAENPDGEGQIVVQEIDGEPVVVGDGVYVTWSPSTRGTS